MLGTGKPDNSTWFTAYAWLMLTVFFASAALSVRHKAPTIDEPIHLYRGYVYWLSSDFRISPSNGVLPMRVAALPSLWRSDVILPDLPDGQYKLYDHFGHANRFYFESRNDADSLLFVGRLLICLCFGLPLGWTIWLWSKQLFGPWGAMLSVTLFAFSPNLLAHARLATSDFAITTSLFIAVYLLHRTLTRFGMLVLMGSCLATSAAVLSKHSGLLLVPIAGVLIGARVLSAKPWRLELFGRRAILRTRRSRLAAGSLLVLLHVAVVFLAIWAAFDFRALADPTGTAGGQVSYEDWQRGIDASGVVGTVAAVFRRWHLLPEGFLYGLTQVISEAGVRRAYLMGEYSTRGFWYFFPVAILVKTPVGTLALLAAVTVGSIWWIWRTGAAQRWVRLGRVTRRLLPLLALIGVYGAVALTSTINIGHRHVLPLYPPVFVLIGVAAAYAARRGVITRLAVGAAALYVAASSLSVHPHYLAYFNEAAGGPKHGRYWLAGASIDWGQDLYRAVQWLDRQPADVVTYLVHDNYFPIQPAREKHRRLVQFSNNAAPISRGGFCVSINSLLFPPIPDGFGLWTPRQETEYQALKAAYSGGSASNSARFPSPEVGFRYQSLRAARLLVWLRSREPDGHFGYSILRYELTDADLAQALDGPPPP